MLSVLHIENVAVIETADIPFEHGFNVLTGETGAGKSIIIDAISAIIGERAYRESIRTGADRAFISAVFDQVAPNPWFEENGVPYDDGQLNIQREIQADGRNICRVNGIPVTVTVLRGLGARLIQIHGQHDSAALFDERNHLALLDQFADHNALIAQYQSAYNEMDQVRRKIRQHNLSEAEKARRAEMLRYQLDEIEKAELKSGEDVRLEQERLVLKNSAKIMQAVTKATGCLSGSDDQPGASALIAEARDALEPLADLSDYYNNEFQRLQELSAMAKDTEQEIQSLRHSLDFSPEKLDQIESRLELITRLKKKYGSDCDEILNFAEKCREELSEIEMDEDALAELQIIFREKAKRAKECAEALSESRKQAASRFENALINELKDLDMPNVRFRCELERLAHLTETGRDGCRFLMSANLGEEMRQMNKVASGGEMARIMLSMKNVLSEKDQIPTMIFDEVDTGVSGRAAQKVAEKLNQVSRGRQVLCVTHLPQIAAAADTHFAIEKEERDGRTFTKVIKLNQEGRKNEVARLISGTKITETTLKNADEMLQEKG